MTIKSRIHLADGNIVNFKGDAIVNAANTHLLSGTGVCGAIFEAAGSYLLTKECEKYSPIRVGDAVLTDSCNLKPNIKAIIHAVGPKFTSIPNSEPFLKDAYTSALKRLVENGYKTIAFPCISTGVYGYPLKEASEVAINTVVAFLKQHQEVEVTFYMYDENQKSIYSKLLSNLGDI